MQQYSFQKCCVVNYTVLIAFITILVVIIWIQNSDETSKNLNSNVNPNDSIDNISDTFPNNQISKLFQKYLISTYKSTKMVIMWVYRCI